MQSLNNEFITEEEKGGGRGRREEEENSLLWKVGSDVFCSVLL